LDKYEYRVRADEIKDLIAGGDYLQAAEIADTIDWRRVKSVMMLCTISDLYKINRRYEDAKNMLLLAYERRPGGKTICYSLCELCIKTEEYVQAINYYKEFVQVAPKDPGRYILQYKLYEAQEVGLEERIGVLEELKKRDYREKWAYELAYLYHRVGLATRCVEECDELILWFGDGKYVIKAMELKMLHQPLSAVQQEKYDHRFDRPAVPGKEPAKDGAAAQGVQAEWLESEQIADGQGQEPEAQVLWDGQGQEPEAQVSWDGQGQEPEAQASWDGQSSDSTVQTAWDGQSQRTEVSSDTRTDWVLSAHTPVVEPAPEPVPAVTQPEELDIQVKTMDVGAYNTLNLQAEIAAGLQEVLAEDRAKNDAITRSIIAPMLDSDTESLDLPEIDAVDENDLEPEKEVMEGTEVFFGETGELGKPQEEETPAPKWVEEIQRKTVPGKEAVGVKEAAVSDVEKSASAVEVEEPGKKDETSDETAVIVMNQLRMESLGQGVEQVLTAQPPKEIAGVLSQESDGQISLVVPENEKIEKQITGQMSIEDVLGEWEKLKRESEARRQEEVRQRVLEQTGNMFSEFEESVKDGLLEQLESEPVKQTLPEDELVELVELERTPVDDTEAPEAMEEASDKSEDTGAAETLEEGSGDAGSEEESEEPGSGEPEAEDAGVSGSAAEAEDTEAPEATEEALEKSEDTGTAETAEEGSGDAGSEEESEEPGSGEPETKDTGGSESAAEVEDTKAPEAMEEASDKSEDTGAVKTSEKVRALTREEKELYAPFIQSRYGREQLVKAIDSISMAAYTGNIIITGEEGMDTLSLAKNMIREVQMTDSNFSGKVAKVSGQGLNSKNVEDTLEHLESGALIVQKASEMEAATVETLQKMLQKENFGIIIVLEDTKKAIEKLLKSYPKLRESFTARMDVEAMSNDSLVAFGRQYAKEREYFVDDLGILALHTRIEERQTIDHVVTVMEVKDIVDEAIRHANRKTLGHFFDILFARRYDEEDMIILTEKDFV